MAESLCRPMQLTPQALLCLAGRFADDVGTALLYSGGSLDSAEKSYLCLFPYESVWVQGGQIWQGDRAPRRVKDPWEALKGVLIPSGDESIPEWVGYLGYGMGATSDPDAQIPHVPSSIPDAYFFRPAVVLALDHHSQECTATVSEKARQYLTPAQQAWLETLPATGVASFIAPEAPLGQMGSSDTLEQYTRKVEAAQELIRDGEIYQVNLSQQFCLQGARTPFPIFHRLTQVNPAPFMAYLRFPEFAVISSSPERFLSKRGKALETRPIKGTAPRGKTTAEDAQNRLALLSSPKERAELLMITDLMRNDLGRVSQIGSIRVEKIWHCETYANVFHLLSIIRSHAKSGLNSMDIIRRCFPGGSITGCPKLRAMEVIHQLEQRARGIYTGSIGYLAGNGDFDFNIAIRTLLWRQDSLEFSLGGAIVADSDSAAEYRETLYKGQSIFQVLGDLSA